MTADGETRFWAGFILEAYPFTTFPPGARVLDVECGKGTQLDQLVAHGCTAVGVEPSQVAARRCRAKGLTVLSATAEHIPLTDGWADGVICKVVVPYAEEKSAIAECGLVLKPGGSMEACYHGVGYYLRCVLLGPSARLRLYGLRSILNSWLYALWERRLPGRLGNTLYQSSARLSQYYVANGLEVERETASQTFLGMPVFIYHRLRKGAAVTATDAASAARESASDDTPAATASSDPRRVRGSAP